MPLTLNSVKFSWTVLLLAFFEKISSVVLVDTFICIGEMMGSDSGLNLPAPDLLHLVHNPCTFDFIKEDNIYSDKSKKKVPQSAKYDAFVSTLTKN